MLASFLLGSMGRPADHGHTVLPTSDDGKTKSTTVWAVSRTMPLAGQRYERYCWAERVCGVLFASLGSLCGRGIATAAHARLTSRFHRLAVPPSASSVSCALCEITHPHLSRSISFATAKKSKREFGQLLAQEVNGHGDVCLGRSANLALDGQEATTRCG